MIRLEFNQVYDMLYIYNILNILHDVSTVDFRTKTSNGGHR